MVDGVKMINIIYEDNHILVVEKKPNIPVCEDESKDEDLLNVLKKYIKEKYNKPGNVYLGLVHRLDRPVGGIMVFAKTSKAASRLSDQVRTHQLKKVYYAVVDGNVKESDTLVDKLLKDNKTNITRVSKDGKEAILDYTKIEYKDNFSLVRINLKTGRSHQIRVQFSSRNHALYGDQKYNKNTKKDNIALFAKELSFYHPTTKEFLTFSLPLPNRYPFNIFEK
jgi:23S rRNA pseudouridine1911/1915/1917 synthase